MPRPAAATCAAALSLLLLLTGCTDPEPQAEPGTTAEATSAAPVPSGSGSPDPSPADDQGPVVVAPERPAAMDDTGYQGAEAAAEYFPRLDSYMMKTNDTSAWKKMSHRRCSTCLARLEQANEIAEAGYKFTGGKTTTRAVHIYEQDSATGIWPVDVKVVIEPVVIYDDSGNEAFKQDRVTDKQRIEVAQHRGHWVILGISDLDNK
ncbi:DUF6318 family protein [Isoptericola aurantiacus]|uniref:DUF6318 family protein n=1 Tax=Isoptericola aurantiacus TaxID=3377839 RepID=UPI00383B9667